ncbi:MAG: 2-oxo acid dehydrogenase subunit E2, partial [Calditrichaeota bacterium]|nr:2-oxo acid dehydrogenase subunit E2 [Calditrichota bacterium]
MRVDVVMPQMGESVVEGTLVKWHKKVGDRVKKDELLYEISTDKVDSEIEAPADGVLVEILVPEGETVPVGTKLAVIETEAEKAETAAAEQGERTEETAPAQGKAAAVETAAAVQTKGPTAERTGQAEAARATKKSTRFYSPLVRSIAKQEGISEEELEQIPGTGAGGRVTKKDILAYVAARKAGKTPVQKPQAAPEPARPAEPAAPPRPAAAPPGEDVVVEPMTHIRKKIAEHMVLAKRTAAHVTSVAEADVTELVRFRESAKDEFLRKIGVRLTYTSFFVEAAAKALREFPYLNASIDGDNILLKRRINIGVAVAVDEGLIVPVIRDADTLNLVGIARALHDLSSRARSKKLSPDDVQGGTFSITNIGTFGNLFGTPVIPMPQVGILGTGAIKKRPVVVEGDAIAIRHMMYISLTYDHRLIDGLYAGRFL